MVNKIILLSVTLLLLSCSSGKEVASDQAKKVLTGKFNWTEWIEKTKWDIIPTYEFYFPEKEKIRKIKELIKDKNYKFIVFASSICEECRENIPQAFKIFHEIGIKEENIHLFGLDNNLEEPTKEYLKYDIPTTPVIYIERDNKVIAEISYPFMWLETFLEVFEGDNQ